MDTVTRPSKSYLQFGVIYGILMILVFVIIYVSGVDVLKNRAFGTSQSVLDYLIFPLLFIYLGCVAFKKNNNGFASFAECLKVGVSVVFVGALIFAVFNLIFNLIFPEYIENILKQTEQIMLEQSPNLTSEQAEQAMSFSRKLSSPLFALPLTIAVFSFLGLIYSLIIGLIVKNDNPQGI